MLTSQVDWQVATVSLHLRSKIMDIFSICKTLRATGIKGYKNGVYPSISGHETIVSPHGMHILDGTQWIQLETMT